MAKGFNVSEAGHVVNLIPPIDGNAGAPVTCARFSMKNYDHASIIVQLGVTGGTPTSILLGAYTLASGGVRTAVGFTYYACTTDAGDVLSGPTTVAATGITSITTNNNVMYVIELNSAELPDGSPYVQLELTLPGSSNLCSAVAILSAGRQQYQASASALV